MTVTGLSGLVWRLTPDHGLEVVTNAETVTARVLVGATAWSIFETLALAAVALDDELLAFATVRSTAAELQLGKDRCASAFTRLRRAGWVELRQARVLGDSRFGGAHYVLHGITIDRTVLVDVRVGHERDTEREDAGVVHDQVVEVVVKSKAKARRNGTREGEWSLFDGLVDDSGVGGG